jgi:hypothetical protein
VIVIFKYKMCETVPACESEAVEDDAAERGEGDNIEDEDDDRYGYSDSDSETTGAQGADNIQPYPDYVPSLLTGNSRCCPTCEAMTGTPEGLNALVSGGYKHKNWYQIWETANLGCRLCWQIQHIPGVGFDVANGNWPDEELVIRAITTALPSGDKVGVIPHPLENCLLQNLEVVISGLVSNEDPQGAPRQILFHPVTWEGNKIPSEISAVSQWC